MDVPVAAQRPVLDGFRAGFGSTGTSSYVRRGLDGPRPGGRRGRAGAGWSSRRPGGRACRDHTPRDGARPVVGPVDRLMRKWTYRLRLSAPFWGDFEPDSAQPVRRVTYGVVSTGSTTRPLDGLDQPEG